ncbi:hypothetical protein JCM11251_006376 [Rhodosporidiobolus azoricus]
MARPAIDYTPKHPQPVTLAQLRQLEPELLSNEITRLQNSIQHLERSNDELREFAGDGGGEDDEVDEESKAEFEAAIRENEETIAAQNERLHMIRLALEEQVGVDAENPHYNLSSTASTALPPASATPPLPNSTAAPLSEGVSGEGSEEQEVVGVQAASTRAAGEGGEGDGMYL